VRFARGLIRSRFIIMEKGKLLHSWHRLIGRDDEFFVLLPAAADEARASVGLLSAYLRTLSQEAPTPPLSNFAESRRRQKQLREKTIAELNKSLVPPFEREDIQALVFALYRIPKVVEKLAERISIYPGRLPCAGYLRQAELLTIAVDAVVFMVSQLRSGADPAKVNAANAKLQLAEGDADKMMLNILRDLYLDAPGARELAILQSYYELMEDAVDRCRDAGNIVMRIAMRNV
jgi:uncharacterized protein Yka (UPF0111/DUF47 family)